MSPTVGSVHSPAAMNNLSIRGRGKKLFSVSLDEIQEYAKNKGLSFVCAYQTLMADLYKQSRSDDGC